MPSALISTGVGSGGEARDHTGISHAVWGKICETILRLKGNMIVAGTWPFPNEPQDRLVADRGLLLRDHATAVARTSEAIQDIDAIRESESKAEHGKWKN